MCQNDFPRLVDGIRKIISVPVLAVSKSDPMEISLISAHYTWKVFRRSTQSSDLAAKQLLMVQLPALSVCGYQRLNRQVPSTSRMTMRIWRISGVNVGV